MYGTPEMKATSERIMTAISGLAATLTQEQQVMLREIDDLHVEELMLAQIGGVVL